MSIAAVKPTEIKLLPSLEQLDEKQRIHQVPLDILKASISSAENANTFRCFLYLKFHYPPVSSFSQDFMQDLAMGMEIHIKTARKHFKILLCRKWVSLDQKRNLLFIRAFRKLNIPYGRTHVQVAPGDLRHYSEFVLAATIKALIKQKVRNQTNALELKNSSTLQKYLLNKRFLTGYYPIAVVYLAKVLNKSPTWIHNTKHEAIRLGLIDRRHDQLDTTIPVNDLKYVIGKLGENLGRYRKQDGRVVQVGIDLIKSNSITRRRKKSE